MLIFKHLRELRSNLISPALQLTEGYETKRDLQLLPSMISQIEIALNEVPLVAPSHDAAKLFYQTKSVLMFLKAREAWFINNDQAKEIEFLEESLKLCNDIDQPLCGLSETRLVILGLGYRAQNDAENAIRIFKLARAAYPRNGEVKHNLNRLRGGFWGFWQDLDEFNGSVPILLGLISTGCMGCFFLFTGFASGGFLLTLIGFGYGYYYFRKKNSGISRRYP